MKLRVQVVILILLLFKHEFLFLVSLVNGFSRYRKEVNFFFFSDRLKSGVKDFEVRSKTSRKICNQFTFFVMVGVL